MSWTKERPLFNSTASTTKAPASYYAAPTADSILNFIDNPFETWESATLVVICLTAFSTCAMFLAIRYAQVLRFKQDNHTNTPMALEAQKARVLGKVELEESHLQDDSPTNSRSHEGDSLDFRRRSRAGYVQPKRIAIGGVREGKIAQRRTSRSRSVALGIQEQSTRILPIGGDHQLLNNDTDSRD